MKPSLFITLAKSYFIYIYIFTMFIKSLNTTHQNRKENKIRERGSKQRKKEERCFLSPMSLRSATIEAPVATLICVVSTLELVTCCLFAFAGDSDRGSSCQQPAAVDFSNPITRDQLTRKHTYSQQIHDKHCVFKQKINGGF